MCELRASPSCFWTSRRPFRWVVQAAGVQPNLTGKEMCVTLRRDQTWKHLLSTKTDDKHQLAVELFSIDLPWQEAIITDQSLSRKQSFEEFWVP